MNMNGLDHSRGLCWHGLLLFLLGLLTGALISTFTNPRMGLSAHMAGVQNGMALLLFGLVWPKLDLAPGQAKLAYRLSVFSMYAIWAALSLAAILGTSRATPIAGAGFEGSTLSELSVAALLGAGSVAIIAGTGLLLHGLRRPASGD